MCFMPASRNCHAACHQRGSRRTAPGSPSNVITRLAPLLSMSVTTVVVRTPRCAHLGSSTRSASSPTTRPAVGTSSNTSSITCPTGISVSVGSGDCCTARSASSYDSNTRSPGSAARTATTCGAPSARAPTRRRSPSAIHNCAASRNVGSARATSSNPAPRVGNETSRILSSGTRTSSRTRAPSGLTNARTITLAGISCACARCPGTSNNSRASAE